MRLSEDAHTGGTRNSDAWGDFRVFFALFFGAFAALFGAVHVLQLIVTRIGDVTGLIFWGALAVLCLRYVWRHKPLRPLPPSRITLGTDPE